MSSLTKGNLRGRVFVWYAMIQTLKFLNSKRRFFPNAAGIAIRCSVATAPQGVCQCQVYNLT